MIVNIFLVVISGGQIKLYCHMLVNVVYSIYFILFVYFIFKIKASKRIIGYIITTSFLVIISNYFYYMPWYFILFIVANLILLWCNWFFFYFFFFYQSPCGIFFGGVVVSLCTLFSNWSFGLNLFPKAKKKAQNRFSPFFFLHKEYVLDQF